MNVIEIANQGLKGIAKVSEAHISLLRRQVAESTTKAELLGKIEAATKDAKIQFVIAQLLVNLSEEAGKYRGGTPTLADSILDEQAAKVKKYGDKAYRLSEKQMMVVVNSTWDWLK